VIAVAAGAGSARAQAPAGRSGQDLLAAARAERDRQHFPEAERLAREGLARFPEDPVWLLLVALILADQGRGQEALELLDGPQALRAPPVERRLAQGYAWRKSGEPYRSMDADLKALELAPANAEARAAVAEILDQEGGPYGAAALTATEAPYAPDEAAAMVRWGEDLKPTDPARRFEGTDAAIARLDSLIAALPPPPASPELRRRLRLDRLIALRDRVRMREAVAEAESLRAEAPLPPYAEEAYADALLYLRRPLEARAAYHRVLAVQPKSRVARYGLFFASVDAEDFKTAYATIDALVKDEPVWLSWPGDPGRRPNRERAYAEITAANARYYADQLAEAWTRIRRLADVAPANPAARMALYQIAAARGWPRRAQAEGEIAAGLAPDSLGAKVARAEIAMAGLRFADAQRIVDELAATYPEDLRVRRLARDLAAARRWLLEIEARPSDSDGGGANAHGRALVFQARLSSPPIADNWQVFALADQAYAHPPEGEVTRSRIGAGLAWRTQDVTATAYATQSWRTLDKAGAGATLDWRPSDELSLAVAGELYAWDTPLRAILHGITADSVSAAASWRWSESRSLSGGVSYMPFTDGNDRLSARLVFAQKVVDLPHLDVTATAAVYASHNDRPEAPYYNPDSDLSAEAGLLAEQVLWRRYEVALIQAFTATLGVYSEAHFPARGVGSVGYEHRWRFDPDMDLHYGVQFSRRTYDGVPENTVTLTAGLRRRF
jgi:biofilm PGA synthesis protein PgaA